MKAFFSYLLTIGLCLTIPAWLGIWGFGPVRVVETEVTRLYVDNGDKQSHYMVGAKHGVFEVDNLLIAWLWNADEIYAKLREGECYRLTVKGNRVVGFLFQEYPYIISAEPVGIIKQGNGGVPPPSASAGNPQPEAVP